MPFIPPPSPPQAAPPDPSGLGFWLAYLRTGRTEPMTLGELAEWFDVGRNRIRKVIEKIPGTERIGGRWTVPLGRMPPSYIVRKAPRLMADAPSCTVLH